MSDEKFGVVRWSIEDLRELFPGVDDDVLWDAIERNEKHFTSRMIELGWDVWDTLISMDLKTIS